MGEETINQYFQVLELSPEAPFSEIKSAYFHLKKLYSSDSPVLSAIKDDITDAGQELLLNRIEEAYSILKEHYSEKKIERHKINRDRVVNGSIPEFEVFSGNALKLTREVLGVRIEEIALATGIPLKHLKNLERERFDLLPPEGYIRIYITRYAEYLSLDTQRVTNDYMKAVCKKNPHTDRDRF